MTRTEPKDFILEEVSVLDWYDGVVRGVGTHQGESYLLTLVAWDLVNGKKAFVLLEIDRVIAEEMKRLCDWKTNPDADWMWDKFNEVYDQHIADYTGPVYFLNENPEVGKKLQLMRISGDHLKHLRNYDFETTMGLSAQTYWFNLK